MRILVREPMSEDTRISIRLHLQNFSAGKAVVESTGDNMVVDFVEAGDAKLFLKSFSDIAQAA